MKYYKITEHTYKGLKAYEDASFPKKCAKCGAEYANLDVFLKQTIPIHGDASGLFDAYNGQSPFVQLYRNCPCKSTLMVLCHDRRNRSQDGEDQRKLFQQMLSEHINSIASINTDEELNEAIGKFREQFYKKNPKQK
ncbi:MAG: hypothetical protein HQM16_12165 [Deltaproteobacteria bacterium]|nr:hypothetical protein [Deltaproteobacteria bacterium]